MSRFIKEDLIHRHETFNRLILDEKSENKGLIDNLTVKYSIKKIIISAYYFQINDNVLIFDNRRDINISRSYKLKYR